jgi:chromosome partitioning protein
MARIVAVSTNKGGVLKTSLCTNLAGAFAANKRVLIVDTDNQGNCLLSFGKNPDAQQITLYDVLVDGVPAESAIVNVHKNIDVLPANDDMSFFEFDVLSDLKKHPKPFLLLKNALARIGISYDVILIDTPPNLGLVQGNVLSYVDEVLIPFQPENYSMRSLVKIMKAIEDFKGKHNPNLSIMGVVATLVDSRTTLHSQVLQECRRFCDQQGIRMFESFIPRSVRFAASIAYNGLPATLSDSKNAVVHNYFDLLKEVEALG